MRVENLAHLAVFTPWVRGTAAFYREILNFREVARPDFGFPGAWLAPGENREAVIHLYGEGPVRPHAWQDPLRIGGWTTGIVAHLSLFMTGQGDLISRCEHEAVPWTVHSILGTAVTQIFFYDPNGLLIECSFDGEGMKGWDQEDSILWKQEFITGGLFSFQHAAYQKWQFN